MAGKAKVYYAVACTRHGKEVGGTPEKIVIVGRPGSKRERMAGCPMCRSENKKEES